MRNSLSHHSKAILQSQTILLRCLANRTELFYTRFIRRLGFQKISFINPSLEFDTKLPSLKPCQFFLNFDAPLLDPIEPSRYFLDP